MGPGVEGSALFGLQRAVLNAGLANVAVGDHAPVDTHTWELLLAWVLDQRLTGLLWHLCQSSDQFSSPQSLAAERAWQNAAAATLVVESYIPAVATALERAGIEWRVLKGVATSRLIYEDPGMRSFCDIDILVRPADLAATLTALAPITAIGAPPLHGPVRSAMLQERQITTARGVEIDIHQAVEGSLVTSRLPIDPFFEQPQSVWVNGTMVLAPSPAVCFVHAVMHFSSAGRRLSTVPDIARLARLVKPTDPVIAALLVDAPTRALFVWALNAAVAWVELPTEWQHYAIDNRGSGHGAALIRWVQRTPVRSSMVNTFLGKRRLSRARETVWPTTQFLLWSGVGRLEHLRYLLKKSSNL